MSTEAFMRNLMEQFAGIGPGLLLLFTFWAGLGIFRNFGYYRMAKKVNVHGAGFIFFPIIWVEPVAGLMKQSYRFYKGKKLDLSGPMFFGIASLFVRAFLFCVFFCRVCRYRWFHLWFRFYGLYLFASCRRSDFYSKDPCVLRLFLDF